MEAIGMHYIVEASGCDPAIIGDPVRAREIFLAAAKVANMDVKAVHFYKFFPSGTSGVVVVSESHISVHTWPENGYAALDVYTCGEKAQPEKAVEFILQAFRVRHAHITEVQRGVKDEDTYTHTTMTWEEDYSED
ncbi:S-adenosylmethionine decarboxylase proenzyme [Thermodesulfobium narugense DSM 14796]|uniref:S-adenosylmethionine decarboxylase proenzyme n=2 Tax=Thermodesulfobium TaxID=227388 RepID=M1E7X1_9BACT|nr:MULTISPECIES: adenosylmethionine decarboxylase [Thermodesulfobium]AEE14179.1 S-adenosylmethionine decarboxylase proenzyme [Thermodesulfobium narugense DSM 14796]AWB09889.1 adenosylmethionine decarboxylase proenzyme [Thermodesulfobium acidiphilum]PMP86181.1 MAG: adenosylmethionine decarboxylase [Thermodesulfobium narugense]HEM55341.1 adenosylmethionine decarboxylase [Thermodesulfobium narugense]